mgnify:CR=1 FL=1
MEKDKKRGTGAGSGENDDAERVRRTRNELLKFSGFVAEVVGLH